MSTETAETAAQPSFTVKGQFIKDLSFENPHAPQSLTVVQQRPAIDVNVDIKARKLQDNFFEVLLIIGSRASVENGTLFLVELAYAGISEIAGASEQQLEQLLFVDCAFVLFPFARRVVADVTRDGGFPPLMLDPIDFYSLYLQNKSKAESAEPAA